MSTTNDAVREVLARLELQAAIIAECKMIEALASLPDADDDESDPADWPAWTDEECWEPGRSLASRSARPGRHGCPEHH